MSTNISTLYTNLFSTNTVLTSSIGGFNTGKPRYAIDISGIVNAQDILVNGIEFAIQGDIETIRTSTLNIAENGLNGSPSTNMRIGGTSIYTYPPTGISYNSNQIIMYSNLINVNSTLNITNTGQVGLNTSSFTTSLMDVSGIITTEKLSFITYLPGIINLNSTIPLNSVNYAFGKWIVTWDSANYGASECVLTSEDGVNWESNVGYNNGYNVFYPSRAVYGSNALVFWAQQFTILTTSDGSNFTQSYIPDQMRVFYASEPNSWIGYANPGFPNYPTFSTDGYDWQGTGTTTFINFYNFTYGPNAYGPNCFAAIANDYFTNELGIFLTYDNGSNWSTRYTAPPNLNQLNDGDAKIVYNGSYYCVLAYNQFSGNRWTAISSNLSNWTLATQEIDVYSFNLQWLSNTWFITTKDSVGNYYYTSTDGLNWTSNTVPALTTLRMIDYNGTNLFMAIGSGSENYQVSQDGLNWYTPNNISYLSTVIESYTPQSTITVNTSTIAKVSVLSTLSYSTTSNITVTDTVLVGTNLLEGLLVADKIGVNTLTPNAIFDVIGNLNVNEKVITNSFLNEAAGGNFISSIAVNKASASVQLDISGKLLATSSYIISSLGVNKNPSYTVDVSGITNATGFYINSVNQLVPPTFSSLTLSTVRVNGGRVNLDYNLDFFNNVNHPFFIYANSTLVTGTYYNNLYRSTDCNTFTVALSNVYPTSFEGGVYNPNINRWGFLRRTDTTGTWQSYTTQDFVNYLSSPTVVSFNGANIFQIVYGSNFFWMIGDNGNSNTSLWRSADGVSWTNIVSPFVSIYSLVYTGSNFLLSGFNSAANLFLTYRTNFTTYSNVTSLQSIRVLSLDFNGSNYMGTGFYFGDGAPNYSSNVEFSSTDSVNWQTNLLPTIYQREYGNYNSPTLWTGTYWARLYYDLTNEYTYVQSNSGTTVSTWSAAVQTPITQGQRVRNNFTYDGSKFWVAGGVGGGNFYTAYATNLFVSSTYVSSVVVVSDFPSTVLYNSTFFEGNTFTQRMNTSTLQSRSIVPIQCESFMRVQNDTESFPTAVARYDVTNYTTGNGSNFPQSVSGSSWPNANLLQGTANVLTTSAPRYITINSLPPNFPSQTGGLHIGTSNSFRTVEMWVRLTRFLGDGQYFFDFRSGADAFSLSSTNPSGAVNGSALIGTTYYRNTLPSQWNSLTNPVLFLSNAGWVQFVQTFPTTITDTPTLFTRFDGATFAFVQGMPIQFADIAFYNEELTSKQITDLYNSKCSRYSLPEILPTVNTSALQIDSLQIINNVSLYSTPSTSITIFPSSLVLNSSITIHQPQISSFTNFTGFTRIQSLFTQSTLGICNNTPLTLFDIQLPSTSGVFSNFPLVRGNARDSNISTILSSINTWASLPGLPQSNTSAYAFYYRGGTTGTSNYKAVPTTTTFFTGQHANLSIDSRITPETLSNTVGLIVSSADQGYYSILPNGTIVEGKQAIWITEALPKIKLTDTDMDPGVWGVITNNKNEEFNSDGTRQIDYQTPFSQDLQGRIRVNGVGEGAMWVTNINGPLENGDYICSSLIPGYGRRQNDDRLHSYTVAKATMSCDFSLSQSNYICQEFIYNNTTYRKAFIGCSYHCS